MKSLPAIIDLRSDTVTRPSAGMRQAIAAAPVGDDQFGEDPSINLLQERLADILGTEAALWLPTGTMANQVALKLFTRPGDDVIVNTQSHAIWHETGGSGANAGVQFTELGGVDGFSAEAFIAACKPHEHPMYPPTTLVEVENTHNRLGGLIFPQHQAVAICEAARDRGIATYLDGARLWNVAAASGDSMASLAAPFDLVMVSLSKGLGAPGGSVLAGSKRLIQQAVRFRRMLGGAMRQVGLFAAAGQFALEHNLHRLVDDHANAQRMARRLAQSSLIDLDPVDVHTNIVVFRIRTDSPGSPTAFQVVERATELGVLAFAFDAQTIRAVAHLDVTAEQCEHAAQVFVECAER